MTNSVDKTLQNIIDQSMTNAFGGLEVEVIEELTEDEKRKQKIATAIAEAQEARRIAAEKEKDLEEVVKYKSEKATTSDEKQKEIVEKSVKNKIEINPEMKESIVGKIYDMYNNKYLSEKKAKKDYDGDGKVESGSKEHAGAVHNAIQKKKGGKQDGKDTRSEAYTLTNADKKGNTKAWQDKDKKNVKTGEPLYKKADHMKKEEVEAVDEKISASGYARAKKWKEAQAAKKDRDDNAKWEEKDRTHKWDGKTWNKRDKPTHEQGTGPHAKKAAAANAKESVEYEAQKKTLTIEASDKLYLLKANGDVAYEVTDLLLPDPLHELNRLEKEQGKKSGGSKDKALNFVRSKIRKETGRPEGQRKKVKGAKSNEKNTSLERKIDKLKSKRSYADRAKKAGFKSTQDYTNTVARYGGEDNYKKGRGLGT